MTQQQWMSEQINGKAIGQAKLNTNAFSGVQHSFSKVYDELRDINSELDHINGEFIYEENTQAYIDMVFSDFVYNVLDWILISGDQSPHKEIIDEAVDLYIKNKENNDTSKTT